MENYMEIRILVKRLFSMNRLKKMGILAKERVLGLSFFVAPNFNYRKDAPSDPLPVTWSDENSRAIAANYFKMDDVEKVEDYVGEDGLIHATYEYVIQELFESSSYTNESTHRSIFDREGNWIEPLSYQRAGAKAPKKARIPITHSLKGTTVNLYGNVASAEGNYLHWFVDSLARLFLVEQFHSLDEIDHILVPPLKYDFHWDSLAYLGFDKSKVVELKPLEHVRCERMLATSSPRGKGSAICPGWIIDSYRKLYLDKAAEKKSVAGKRVYISRRDAPKRMFTNEHDVCSFMEKQGFDIVELTPLDLLNKIAVFHEADVIVSQSGAGLTNLMFCKPDTEVLELVDKNFVYPLWSSIVAYTGVKHHAHFFSDDAEKMRSNAMTVKTHLDIDKLTSTMSDLRLLN